MSSFKNVIKEHLPLPLLRVLWTAAAPVEVASEFIQDAIRYSRISTSRDGTVSPKAELANLEAQLTKDYHRVEKGLTLESPKRPFGAAVQQRIAVLLPAARLQSPESAFVKYSEEALSALQLWNSQGEIHSTVSPVGDGSAGGFDQEKLEAFFQTRRSVRHYDTERVVDPATIRQAAKLAQNTPSVCNRQAARLHVFTDPERVREVLSYQNGNSGFREQVPAVAVVTVDSRLFTGTNERNQRWVDGGLYGMSFVWALHGLGLQSCMLNWSVGNRQSKKLRSAASIPEHEDVIFLIAFGHAAENHRIARSERRSVDEVLKFHDI